MRVATHTPLLSDLGGSMALRDMLSGGFVWVGRTANSLSGPVAFNGRLPVDPRTIPEVAGMAYLLSGLAREAMLCRSMWTEDFYDFVRNEYDEPIGYPAPLGADTLRVFGGEYARWVAHMANPDAEPWTPDGDAKASGGGAGKPRSVDAVLAVLASADHALSMDELDQQLRAEGNPFTTKTIRDALAVLRKHDPPLVVSEDRTHRLTERGVQEALVRVESAAVEAVPV
jgi:hypothetical protein